jgi:hypothetical protein
MRLLPTAKRRVRPSEYARWLARKRGAEYDQTRYWEVVEAIGQATLFQVEADLRFFNTETGNFALFQSADGKEVVAEIVSAEHTATLPWRGLRFVVNADTRRPLPLHGLTCFFDVALTLPDLLLPQPALYVVDQQKPWNAAVLDCHYDAAYEVAFKSDTLELAGICFRQEAL